MEIRDHIFNIRNETAFNRCCLKIFNFQARKNPVYRKYLELLGTRIDEVDHYLKIPFLPIEFFKTQEVICENGSAELVFTSSGTTGARTSRHLVPDPAWYEQSFQTTFETFYGRSEDQAILALLPSYLERTGSSLIYMVDDLIQRSTYPESGYFLDNHLELFACIEGLKKQQVKTVLFGVTYALLDFVEKYRVVAPELIVIETGGMKGRRKEMVREELHALLCSGFGVANIHSEYGMTELLSQAYSSGRGRFRTPPWMKILIRDTNDPLHLLEPSRSGAVNVIDLANYHSCAFIATQDLGRVHPDGSFEILGRFDHSDIRGCNLLVQ